MTLQQQYSEKDEDYYVGNRTEMIHLIPVKSKKVLDIGCGSGAFLHIVKGVCGAETWGVEPFESEAKKTENFVDTLIISSIEEAIPKLPKHYFDAISFNDVLEHLLNPEDILKKSQPLLSENGVIVASIPNILYFYVFIREIFLKQDWKYENSGILDNTHIRFFTKKSIIRMFESAGYTITSIEGINGTKTWKFRIFNALTFGKFSDMQYLQFAVVASPKK